MKIGQKRERRIKFAETELCCHSCTIKFLHVAIKLVLNFSSYWNEFGADRTNKN